MYRVNYGGDLDTIFGDHRTPEKPKVSSDTEMTKRTDRQASQAKPTGECGGYTDGKTVVMGCAVNVSIVA